MIQEEKETGNHEHCHSCQEIILLDFVQELDVFSFFLQEIFLQKCIKNKKQPFRVKLLHQNIAIFLKQTEKVDPSQKSENTKKKNKNSRLSCGSGRRAFILKLGGVPLAFPLAIPLVFPPARSWRGRAGMARQCFSWTSCDAATEAKA